MHSLLSRLGLFAALLVATPVALTAQDAGAGPTPIPLDDAIHQAQEHSIQTVQASGQQHVALANYRTAIGGLLPNLSFYQGSARSQGSAYVQGILLPYGSGWSNQQGYGANITLFNGGRNILRYMAAKASLDAARDNGTVQAATTALDVKQQYFTILADRENIAAAEQQVKEDNEQLEITVAKLAGGAASRADSLTSAVTVGQAKVKLLTAQENLVTANAQFTHMIGATAEVTALPSDTSVIPTIGLDSATLLQLAMRGPAVEAGQHQVNADHSNWWASIAAYLPTLGMSYSSGSGWQTSHFILGGGTKATTTSLSFYVNYDLFDGFQREAQVVQADADRENARAQLRDSRLAAREGITQYLAQFHTAVATIDLQRLQIESASQNLAAKQAQYSAGAAALVDVLTAETSLATARQGLIQARSDARTAKAQIEAIIGKDID